MYSVEEQIKQGFITAENGERIGIAGEYVYERGQPLTIRKYSSVCIRIPHEIIGCATEIYQCCMSDKVKNSKDEDLVNIFDIGLYSNNIETKLDATNIISKGISAIK